MINMNPSHKTSRNTNYCLLDGAESLQSRLIMPLGGKKMEPDA
jgi:hypothetical protein